MGKSKGAKYSSYLDDLGQLRLEKFCLEFNCSKAKAISYLLELWEKKTINDKLATIIQDVPLELQKKLADYLESKFLSELMDVKQQLSECQTEIESLKRQFNSSH